MDKFRRAVARFPSPKTLRAQAEEESNRPKNRENETQTESVFPSWIPVLAEQLQQQELEELLKKSGIKKPDENDKKATAAYKKQLQLVQKKQQIQQQKLDHHHQTKQTKRMNEQETLPTTSNKKNDAVAELEYIRRLHCQEYKQLQQLREIIRQHLTSLGASVYDLCAYKDLALTMKERFTVGPISDLVLLSSKLFRRCSDLSRSLGTFFNISFADDFCDRDFDFSDMRLTKLSLRRLSEQLDTVTNERDDLQRRVDLAEAQVSEFQKSHDILKKQREDAENRYNQVSQDMSTLFQKTVDEVLQSEQTQLRNSDMSLTAHSLVAPARSIAQQSVGNAIDKLSNVVSSLKTLHEDVASVDYGGAMRTSVRNCEGLVANVLTRLAHVRDGVRTSADAMTTEIQNRKKAVELSVLHVLAAEKMRTKLRMSREALDVVRQRAVVCSDLIRESRLQHLMKNQERNNRRHERRLARIRRRKERKEKREQEQEQELNNSNNNNPSSTEMKQKDQQHKKHHHHHSYRSDDYDDDDTESTTSYSSASGDYSSATGSDYDDDEESFSDSSEYERYKRQQQKRRRRRRKHKKNKKNQNDDENASSKNDNNSPLMSEQSESEEEENEFGDIISPSEPFHNASEFSDVIASLLHAITQASECLFHGEELADIIDSLSCRIPQSSGIVRPSVPSGREVLDRALESAAALTASSAGGAVGDGTDQSSVSANNLPDAQPFQQFAEMALFMREMFEERIRELEERRGETVSAALQQLAPRSNQLQFTSLAEAENAKTEAELLEEQAINALEGWRRRRKGENNAGKDQVAQALRGLDQARAHHLQHPQHHHHHHHRDGSDYDSDEDEEIHGEVVATADGMMFESVSLVIEPASPDQK